MKTTEEALTKKGWEWAIDLPEEKKIIFAKFESIGKGFKVGVLKNGEFKTVSFQSVKHHFVEDRSCLS